MRSCLTPLDKFRLGCLAGVYFTGQVVICFHLVFLATTAVAFRRPTTAFLFRAVPAFVIVTVELIVEWRSDELPFDEVLELPILAGLVIFVHVVAVRRQRLAEEVEHHHLRLERLQENRLAELREQLLLTQRMESAGRTLTSTAHDINNVLATIQATTERIALAEPAEIPELADHIEGAVTQAAQLLENVVDFVGGQSDVLPYCGLDDVVRETLAMHGRSALPAVRIETWLAAGAARVSLRRVLAYQVLSNLIINALTAMPEGGTIRVESTVDEAAGEAILTVEDDGLGMGPDVAAKAFEPFFTTRPQSGSGLGLYTVSQIIENAGGSVDLTTEPGVGTRFVVRVPLYREEATIPTLSPRFGSGTVVVVEDDVALLNRWTGEIGSHGYSVISAADGPEAIRLVDQLESPPDLLITDLVMPRMSGLEVISSLRAKYPGLPAILVSAYRQRPTPLADWDQSVSVLPKPFPSSALLAAVHELLNDSTPGSPTPKLASMASFRSSTDQTG